MAPGAGSSGCKRGSTVLMHLKESVRVDVVRRFGRDAAVLSGDGADRSTGIASPDGGAVIERAKIVLRL